MNKNYLFLALFYFTGCFHTNKDTTILYVFSSTNPVIAHKSANVFATMVGKKLKQEFPSKVSSVSVMIKTKNDTLIFIWKCVITPCSIRGAERHFDRRGTLLSGNTNKEAYEHVEAELKSSRKIVLFKKEFKKTYGMYRMPNKFICSSYAKQGHITWCVREFFCTAP